MFVQVAAGGGHGGGADDGMVVDYRGTPVDKSKTGGWLGAGLILGTRRLHCWSRLESSIVGKSLVDLSSR